MKEKKSAGPWVSLRNGKVRLRRVKPVEKGQGNGSFARESGSERDSAGTRSSERGKAKPDGIQLGSLKSQQFSVADPALVVDRVPSGIAENRRKTSSEVLVLAKTGNTLQPALGQRSKVFRKRWTCAWPFGVVLQEKPGPNEFRLVKVLPPNCFLLRRRGVVCRRSSFSGRQLCRGAISGGESAKDFFSSPRCMASAVFQGKKRAVCPQGQVAQRTTRWRNRKGGGSFRRINLKLPPGAETGKSQSQPSGRD